MAERKFTTFNALNCAHTYLVTIQCLRAPKTKGRRWAEQDLSNNTEDF